ncbi:hypothetical protein SK128_001866, partial [Halocaridina rubra]
DPKGNIVKRWVSKAPHIGVVSLKFSLPDLPEIGWWRLQVKVRDQLEEKKFLVTKIYDPLFEVFVELPFYGMSTDEEIVGVLTGSYVTDKPVYGNASLTLSVKQPWTLPDSHYKEVDSLYFEYVDVEEEFHFPMSSLLSAVEQVEGSEVKVDVVFHDVFTSIKAEGSSRYATLNLGQISYLESTCY